MTSEGASDDIEYNDASKFDFIVFQCKKCNSIISDSLAFHAADETMRGLIVKTACNVTFQANNLVTAKKGVDIGSTYFIVYCATQDCKSVLGRLYKTTARHLDHIRDMFMFDADAIKSYKLGSCPPVPELGATQPSPTIPSIQSLQQIEERLMKTQHLLLVFNERLETIEKSLFNSEVVSDSQSSQSESSSQNNTTNNKKRDSSQTKTENTQASKKSKK